MGYLGRDSYETRFDLAEKMVEVFKAYCVPFKRGDAVEPEPPFLRVPSYGEVLWIDRYSRLSLSVSTSRCEVSDQFGPMKPREHKKLRVLTAETVEELFPMLAEDKTLDGLGWEESVFWAHGPWQHETRWGVGLFRPSTNDRLKATSLWLTLSRQTERERNSTKGTVSGTLL